MDIGHAKSGAIESKQEFAILCNERSVSRVTGRYHVARTGLWNVDILHFDAEVWPFIDTDACLSLRWEVGNNRLWILRLSHCEYPEIRSKGSYAQPKLCQVASRVRLLLILLVATSQSPRKLRFLLCLPAIVSTDASVCIAPHGQTCHGIGRRMLLRGVDESGIRQSNEDVKGVISRP